MRFARLLVVVGLLALPHPATAAHPIIVGNGTPASCTGTALQRAVALAAESGGGPIRFNCGRGPVTIALAEPVIIPHNTTIDGGGAITLSRTGAVTNLILVSAGSSVALKDLTFDQAGGTAGFALVNDGTVTIRDSTFSNNFVTVLNEGVLTVVGSTFSDNGCFECQGSIVNTGTLTVKRSVFSNNQAGAGGAISNEGTLRVEHSTFTHNEGDGGFGFGGAIVNDLGGTATITASSFYRNDAALGGSIANAGRLTVTNTVFDGVGLVNAVAGGGIFNSGQASVSNSEFVGNFASIWGGAVFNNGSLRISKSSITGNTAIVGGGGIYTCVAGDPAVHCFGAVGSLELSRTEVTGNTPNDIVP